MIYPNFSRRTLALILSCLVMTLGGVGLLFLIYIFNESGSLLSGPLEKTSHSNQNQQYKQNGIKSDEYKFDKKIKNQHTEEIKDSINRTNIYKNRSSYFPKSSDGRVISFSINRNENNNKMRPIALSTKEIKTTEVNLDTIYIDDFDRSTYNRKNKNEIGNIDYFDVILVDHKEDKALNDLKIVPNHLTKYKNFIFETLRNNTKKKFIKGKPGRNNGVAGSNTKSLVKGVEGKNISDEDNPNLSDSDSTGSGSGDFSDDAELSEINANKASDDKNVKKVAKKKKLKKQRRWKHPHYLFENYSKILSSPTRLTTSSYANNNHVKGLLNKKSTTNLPLNPIYIEQLKAGPFSKESSKKIILPNSLTRYNEIFYNDSYSGSLTTLQYNNNLHEGDPAIDNSIAKLRETDTSENNEAWIETRTRRIMGNVKKSEERSRQLLLCEEAGGGELCRMLFKGHVNE